MADIADNVNELLNVASTSGTAGSLQYSNSTGDISFSSACNEVAAALPVEVLLPVATHTTTLTAINPRRILQVKRTNSGVDRICRELDATEYYKASDSNSLYHISTNEANYPAYFVENNEANDTQRASTIKVLPNATGVKVLCYDANLGRVLSSASTDGTQLTGLPENAYQAVIYKTCINILVKLISDAVQDDEDTEMLQMLNNQAQLLQGLYASALNAAGANMAPEGA